MRTSGSGSPNESRQHSQPPRCAGRGGGNPNGAAALRRAAKGNVASVAAQKSDADAFLEGVRDTVGRIKASRVTSLAGIAEALNAQTAWDSKWHTSSVKYLVARLG